MAQLERAGTSSVGTNSPGHGPSPSFKTPPPISHQTSPTFEHLLKPDEAKWSPSPMSPSFGINKDHQQQDHYVISPRKSVIARVKERAKKLRYSLSGRKKLEDGIHNNAIPCSMHHHSWPTPVPFNNHNMDRDDNDDDEEQEIDPEYLGAPMYESEAAPESLKETARQHPRAVPVISEKHRAPTSPRCKAAVQQENNKPLSPSTAKCEAARIQGRVITTSGVNTGNVKQQGVGGNSSSPQTWDRGVSVKEYFMNKLEPGENERALSQAITEVISPRKSNSAAAGDQTRVVDKVKGAVTSLLWNQDQPSSSKTVVSKSYEVSSPSSLARASSSGQSLPNSPGAAHARYSSQIPVSYNAYKSGIEEESNQGKILQANQ